MNLVDKIKKEHFSDNVQEDVVDGVIYLKEDIYYQDHDGSNNISTRRVKIDKNKAYIRMYSWDHEKQRTVGVWEKLPESPNWEAKVMR